MEKTATLNTYKAVFENIPTACILLQPDYPNFTIVDVNAQFADSLGWPKDHYIGKAIFDAMMVNTKDPESVKTIESLKCCLQQAIITKNRVDHGVLRFNLKHVDTEQYEHRYWTSTSTPILDQKGDVLYLLNCPVDVTEKQELAQRGRKLEEVSSTLREFYHSVFLQAPVGIGIWEGPDFVTKMINPALAKFYHRDEQSLVGRPIFEAFPESRLLWGTIMTNVMETGNPYTGVELAVDLTVDGQVQRSFVNFSIVPYYEPDGRMSGVLGVSIDSTQQVILRKALEKSELIMKIAVESAGLGIWDLDLKTRTVFSSSHIWIAGFPLEKSTYPLEEFLNQLIPEDRKKLDEVLSGCATHYSIILRAVWADKSLHWIQLTGNILKDEHEQPVRVVGTTLDITDRKELEQRKDELLSTVSHELKTPVTSIKAIAQLLEKKFEPMGDQMTIDLLHKLVNQVKRLTNLIHDLLDASLIEGGKLQLNKNHFLFNELLEEVVSDVQRTTNTHQIILRECPEIHSFSDKERIRQVIINMLTNAIKYSPKADKVHVSLELNGSCVNCSVEDFGIGIAKEKQAQIFERFYRVIDDKHSGFQGIGIGLYISKQIITRLDGKIWFESKPTQGTIFRFEIPQF
jgi:two-component system sensor histidine kinase VicK